MTLEHAQRRKGEDSPFKSTRRSTRRSPATPLNEGRGKTPPSSWEARPVHRSSGPLNEGRGKTPPSSATPASSPRCGVALNEGRGKTPPSSDRRTCRTARSRSARSTKEGGRLPLQVVDIKEHQEASELPLNEGRGKTPPSRTSGRTSASTASTLNEGRGKTPPSRPGGSARRGRRRRPLNEGRGKTPPSRAVPAALLVDGLTVAQRRKGEDSPFKGPRD